MEDSAIKDYNSSDEDAVSLDFPKTVEHTLEILTDDLKIQYLLKHIICKYIMEV